ncbi:MAG: DUF72 domain-containing protein [Acidobacteria bacterium]|nr:DUF72 domain-containing protein [Acidobacteriota bacterium]
MIYFGPAGWSYRDWEGIFYPHRKGKAFDPLAFAARYFDTIEINSSFYHPPAASTAGAWAKRISENPRFKFTAKIWQKFTHERQYAGADLDLFLKGIDPLASSSRLGALLVQFPWSFKNENEPRDYLVQLVRRFDGYPLVVELRHASWDTPGVFELLQSMNIGFCNIDQPVIGKSMRPLTIVTSSVGYFRMHGRNYGNWFRDDADVNERYDYLYDSEELLQARELVGAIAEKSRETYVILNNHRNAQAASNALELQSLVTGRTVAAPQTLVRHYPRLQQYLEREKGLFDCG